MGTSWLLLCAWANLGPIGDLVCVSFAIWSGKPQLRENRSGQWFKNHCELGYFKKPVGYLAAIPWLRGNSCQPTSPSKVQFLVTWQLFPASTIIQAIGQAGYSNNQIMLKYVEWPIAVNSGSKCLKMILNDWEWWLMSHFNLVINHNAKWWLTVRDSWSMAHQVDSPFRQLAVWPSFRRGKGVSSWSKTWSWWLYSMVKSNGKIALMNMNNHSQEQ